MSSPGETILMLLSRTGIARLLLLWLAAGAYAQSNTDPVERSMEFIDKSSQATELFNQGQFTQALPIFQSLVQSYSDQDTDGFAGLGLGDCLAAMGRFDEARAAYQAIRVADERRQALVQERLEELALKAPITDETIARLRASAGDPNPAVRFASAWRLARALQKRSIDYLAEAAQAFRSAAAAPSDVAVSVLQLSNQAVYLDELVDDLRFLVDEVEGRFNLSDAIKPSAESVTGRPVVEQAELRQVVRLPDGKRVEIVVKRESESGCPTVKVDGRELELSPAQKRLLQRHDERMIAIILEAAGKQAQSGAARAGKTR